MTAQTPTASETPRIVTDVLVVEALDMSGSMGSCWAGAIEGHNDYLRDLKADTTGETKLWLTAFDTIYEDWHQGDDIKAVDFLNDKKYVPRGGTALYDAIAHTITKADEFLKSIGRDETSDNPMKVLHVTLTDGQENSSKEYAGPDGATRLRKLIKAYEGKGNWTFIYLGANQDAHATGAFMGYSSGSTVNYSSTNVGTRSANDALKRVTHTHRASGQMSSMSPMTDAGLTQDLPDAELDPTLTTPGGVVMPGPNTFPSGTPPAPEAPQGPKANETPITKKGIDDLLGGGE